MHVLNSPPLLEMRKKYIGTRETAALSLKHQPLEVKHCGTFSALPGSNVLWTVASTTELTRRTLSG